MPASAEDCEAAFRFAFENAERFGVDPERIAVGGDSAGGNLGAVVSQAMKAAGGPMPAFQWLIYPSTALGTRTRSYELFENGFLLTGDLMEWFQSNFLRGGDRSDLRASPLHAEDLSGLPPAYVATGGFDPLRDEGEAYAARLREAGVPVRAAALRDPAARLREPHRHLARRARCHAAGGRRALDGLGSAQILTQAVSRGRSRPGSGEPGLRWPISP